MRKKFTHTKIFFIALNILTILSKSYQVSIIDCRASIYGCCPDGITPADGPNLENCYGKNDSFDFEESCEISQYGCCADNYTPAKGPSFEGCIDYSCRDTEFGCCNDLVTPAKSADLSGCPADCTESKYGCCPDGKTTSRGTHNSGCESQDSTADCSLTEFGCCEDGVTVALNPFKENCPDAQDGKSLFQKSHSEKQSYLKSCSLSEYECCPDGFTPANGPGFKDCSEDGSYISIKNLKIDEKDLCLLPEPEKNCYNYSLKWRYDSSEGRCVQFWFGGCDPNQNLFNTNLECEGKCVNPNGTDICKLPLVNPTKTCQQNLTRYFYDINTSTCRMFTFSGCYGNGNNFLTMDECERRCQVPLLFEQCSFIPDKGPCRGDHERWYYDSKVGQCKTFTYGGCMKNKNNHLTESDCIDSCVKPKQKSVCLLPKIIGNCDQQISSWYYDSKEGKCKEMMYSGCNGNLNRFESLESCAYTCQGLNDNIESKQKMLSEICEAPKVSGSCHLDLQRWFYNSTTMMCQQFTYTGCDSNANNFENEVDCRTTCNAKIIDACQLPMDHGTCDRYKIYWYYNQIDKECERFYYGGCDGNQNRFETKEMCEMDCKMTKEEKMALLKLPKQCLEPMDYGLNCGELVPKYYFDTQSKTCFPFEYSGCGPEFSNRFDSNDVCIKTCVDSLELNDKPLTEIKSSTSLISIDSHIDVCALPMAKGNCSTKAQKWFYDSDLKYCRQFEFTGCNGNENRFETRDQCTEICEIPKRREICNSNKAQGPCDQIQIRWYLDTETSSCKEFRYGGCLGNENNFLTLLDCKNFCWEYLSEEAKSATNVLQSSTELMITDSSRSQQTNTNICSLEPKEGKCFDKIERWFYDSKLNECRKFNFTGCDGNENNFETKEKCNSKCSQGFLDMDSNDVQNPCEASIDISTHCLDQSKFEILSTKADIYQNVLVWFFDIESRMCKSIAEDCISETNLNRFQTYQQCISQCIPNVSDKQTQADCYLPIDSGNKCNFQIWRWYYDAKAGQCNLFSYSGCHGNNNNFASNKDCLSLCATIGGHECPSLNDCNLDCENGRVVSLSNCELCECNDPCQNVRCSSSQSCVIENSVAICREHNKPGMCPEKHLINNQNCSDNCKSDANCTSNLKCCMNGCSSFQCVEASFDTEPIIEEFKSSVGLKQGETLVLPCKVSGYPTPTVLWFKNHEEMIFDSKDQRISLSQNNSLVIKNVNEKDEAIYSCRASSLKGKAVVKESNVIINVEAYIKHGSYEKFELFGYDVALNCNISGRPYPKVEWFFKNSLIKPDPFKFSIYPNMILIKRFDVKDVGIYTCKVSNQKGKSSSVNITLNRAVPGEVKFNYMQAYGDVNSSIILKCNFTGAPSPIISWQTPNYKQISENSDKFEIINQTDLKINSLEYKDTGIYRCSAVNQFSSSLMKKKFGTVHLNVYSPPLILSKSETFYENTASKVMLNCLANGIPKPEISWYKDDKEIVKNQIILSEPYLLSKFKFSSSNGSLIIYNLNKDDIGTYICLASSLDRFPVASLNHTLKVLSNKNFITKTFTINIEEDEIVKLSCNIDEEDEQILSVEWTVNNTLKLDLSKKLHKYESDNFNTLLIIKNTELTDNGTYECLAETDTKDYLTKIRLVVNRNPNKKINIESKTKEIKTLKDKSILLDCAWWFTNTENFMFDTDFKRAIQWKLNETLIEERINLNKYEFLDSYNTLLKINKVQYNEAHNDYICNFKISNNFIKQSIFKIQVGDMPSISTNISELKQISKWYEILDTITLECPIDGKPTPKKTWYHNSTLIASRSNKNYEFKSDSYSLKINELDESLQGVYTCNATNDFGSEFLNYKIEIAYPIILKDSFNKSIKAKKSDDLRLKCEYSSGKPEPIATWLFNGIQIEPFFNSKYLIEANILTVRNILKDDGGVYTCILSNGYHKSQSMYFTVKVLDKISIKFFPENPVFTVGNEGKLNCLVQNGVSINQVHWFKNGNRLKSGKKFNIDGTTLNIVNITMQDAGKYSCRIGGKESNSYKSVNVKVIDHSIKIDCEDKSSYNDCKLVVSKDLCHKWGKYCCRTCRQSGFEFKLN